LNQEDNPDILKVLRQHAHTGRPLGDDKFIDSLEKMTGRILRKQKPGPKKKG
jgi:putative transposase